MYEPPGGPDSSAVFIWLAETVKTMKNAMTK